MIGDKTVIGVTDEDGILSAPISADVPTGKLFLTGGIVELPSSFSNSAFSIRLPRSPASRRDLPTWALIQAASTAS